MTIPSRDPADDGTLLGTFKHVLRKHLQNTDDMLPAKVIAFDRATGTAQVQPMIQLVTTSGERKTRPQIASVPVMQLGAGNVMLSFALQPGDLGWIKANDRDISLYLQSYQESAPNTKRMHNFGDAIFIPDVMTGFTIPGEDEANATLQTLDGSHRLSVAPTYVKMTAGNNFVTVSDTVATMQVGTTMLSVTASGISFTVGGTTMTMGSGGITTNGNWAHTGTLSANGIGLTTHRHSGVQAGGSNSGGPVA